MRAVSLVRSVHLTVCHKEVHIAEDFRKRDMSQVEKKAEQHPNRGNKKKGKQRRVLFFTGPGRQAVIWVRVQSSKK